MKYLILSATLLASSTAFAADKSKALDTAEFRVKVAVCKADSKEHGVKAASTTFYTYMAGCLDRVTVATNVAEAK
jgi:hypothetical protein